MGSDPDCTPAEKGGPRMYKVPASILQEQTRCVGRHCGRPIVWAVTPTGARMCLDVEVVEHLVTLFEGRENPMVVLRPHWGSCPDRDRFRRRPTVR